MARRSEGISTTAVVAVVVGGILTWSGLRGWKVSLVLKDFLSATDPNTDPNLQKPENQLPISVGGLATEALGTLLGGLYGGSFGGPGGSTATPGSPGGVYVPGQGKVMISDITPIHPQENFKYAQLLAGQFGWNDPTQLNAWYTLGMKESGWNATAQNPKSTAFGIGQFLDSTWGKYGPKTSDPYLQTYYMAQYIRDRYGTPANALAFHIAHNWY